MELVEGERIERVHRPHPLGALGLYAIPLALLVLAAGFWLLFRTQTWERFLGQDASEANLALAVATGVVALAVMATGYAGMRISQRGMLFAGGVLAAAAVSLAAPLLGARHAGALPAALALVGLAGIAIADLARRRDRCLVTNYRLVFPGDWPRGEERSIRLTRVADVEARPSWLGRWLDHGTLVLHLEPGAGSDPLRLRGVRPLSRRKDQLLTLIRRSSEPEFLGDKSDAVRRVDQLLKGSDE